MIIGTYSDGRQLDYDEPHFQFSVQGTPVSLADVKAADAAGQITWVLTEQRTWLYSIDEGSFARAHEAACGSQSAAPQQAPDASAQSQSTECPQGTWTAGQGAPAQGAPSAAPQPTPQPSINPNVEFVTKGDPNQPPKKKLGTAAIVVIIIACTIALSCGICAIGGAIISSKMPSGDLDTELENLTQNYDNGYTNDYDSYIGDNSYTDNGTNTMYNYDAADFYDQGVTFEPQTYSGTGDQVIDLPDNASYGIMQLVSSDGEVQTSWVDANDSSVSEFQKSQFVGSMLFYTDTAYYDFYGGTPSDGAYRDDLKVYSDGNWTIRVLPIDQAETLSGSTSGTGYAVYKVSSAGSWTFTAGSGNDDLEVTVIDKSASLTSSEISLSAGQSGTLSVDSTAQYALVLTTGQWSASPATT